MDLTVNKTIPKERQYVSLLMFYVVTILLAIVPVMETSIPFVIPLLLVAYNCGYRYIITYYLAIFSISVFATNNQLTFVVAISVGIIIQILAILKITKPIFLYIVTLLICVLYLSIYTYNITDIALASIITGVHLFLYEPLIPLIMHKNINAFTDRRWLSISIICLLCIVSIIEVNFVYSLILIRYFLILSLFYLGVSLTVPCVLYISIILIIQNYELRSDVLTMLLPCFIYFIYKPSDKWKFTSVYIISHTFLPFFITYDLYLHSFVIITSGFLFLITPTFNKGKNIMSTSFKQETMKNVLARKTDNFSQLFNQLVVAFQTTTKQVPASEYAGYVYEDLCSTCTKKQICYYQEKGVNRLVRTMYKGISYDLGEDDIVYIDKHCDQSKLLVEFINDYHTSYQNAMSKKQNADYLKNDLSTEFSILADVFSSFKDEVVNTYDKRKLLLDHLEAYQFSVKYLSIEEDYRNSLEIEIGIHQTTKQIIKEELQPIIESFFNITIEVDNINQSVPYLGYYTVVFKQVTPFVVQYGVQQTAFYEYVCGDSFGFFHYNGNYFGLISDGMGQGDSANKESRLAVDIFSRLIKNGVDVNHAINTINTILKLKNNSDIYTTLDICCVDEHLKKATFIKYGSYTSFHIRNKNVQLIESDELPIGVVRYIPTTKVELDVYIDDVIILASDGVGNDFINSIERQIDIIDIMTAQEIATLLMDCVKNEENDDCTILVCKIIEK